MYRSILSIMFFLLFWSPLMADDAGSRGSFTRGGWVGARYIAQGMNGVVMSDDIFSLYLNPAVLSELKSRKEVSSETIAQQAGEGRYGEIDETDLLHLSETDRTRGFFDMGAAYTRLDFDRDVFFGGCAFGLFDGVFGAGLYSILSKDIETRNSAGVLMGKTKYCGAAGYLSYSWSSSLLSLGISVKPLYEKIEESTYVGMGSDFGVQIFLLPFIKVGVMARDLGSFLGNSSFGDPDFFRPEVSAGISFLSDSGLVLSGTAVKRMEQEGFYFGGGMEYELTSYFSIFAGMFDESFMTGCELDVLNKVVAYSLAFDRIDGGYNNTVSVELLF